MALPNPPILRRQLGAELRRLRERSGRTIGDVVGSLNWSESKLSRIETAQSGIRKADLDRLLDVYGLDGPDRPRLAALAAQSRQRAWWQAYGDALLAPYEAYIAFEAEATSILTYEAQLVPGLLQTAEYARTILRAHDAGDDPQITQQRLAVRMARQTVLDRDPPPRFDVVLDEAVLSRPVGGTEPFRRQLLRLLEVAERPTVTLQVIPFRSGAHPGMSGSFVILEYAAGSEPIVYSEGRTGGVFRNKPEELRSYRTSFEALRGLALDPQQTRELIISRAESR